MTSMPVSPFAIFPWQRPFLADLKKYIETTSGENAGNAVIIVPNLRPWRYFLDLYIQEKKPALVPKMIPFAEVVNIWRSRAFSREQYLAGWLDQAALLRQCVLDVANQDTRLAHRFANMDMARFLPWGMRLARLLEEMFINGIDARDISHAEANVSQPAAALLGALGRINERWRTLLAENRCATPGYEQYLAAADAQNIPSFLAPDEKKQVFIAGFYELNGCQEKLFKSLWEAGAQICLHTDPEIISPRGAHWACGAHQDWLRRWKTEAHLAMTFPQYANKPQTFFYAGYDCHSQLEEMARVLERPRAGESEAIVLATPDILMPVLHHMPRKDINISIGYPLARGVLSALLEDLLDMHNRKTAEGFYWRDLLKIVNQPYLRMLEVFKDANNPQGLREYFRLLDTYLREGKKYVSLAELLAETAAATQQEIAEFVGNCLDTLIEVPGQAKTLRELSTALEQICALLLEHGGNVWNRFPLDAEALWRLRGNVLPVLKNNALADETFAPPVLHGIFRQLVEDERIPFEADPLMGVQILGMLETRLLQFDHVIFLDATDDILPGQKSQDPLMPDSLRSVLDLPDRHTVERIQAYNLFRLCASARTVRFLWQEGISHSSLFDSRKTRSRFVEQLIWDYELENGKILKCGPGPLKAATADVNIISAPDKFIDHSKAVATHLDRFFNNSISPTAINHYLKCPLSFAWKYLLNIAPAIEVNEEEDASLAGICVHDALYELYRPWIGREVKKDELRAVSLKNLVKNQMEAMNLREKLPASSYLMLEIAAPVLLDRYLEKQPEKTGIVCLEKKLDVKLPLAHGSYDFTGRIDRLDRRDGKLVLLDYKTGHIDKFDSSIWRNAGFFEALQNYSQTHSQIDEEADIYLDKIRELLPSLQLPCYVAMLAQSAVEPIANAALVELAREGEEKKLFADLEDRDLASAAANCRYLLEFILLHMRTCKAFPARKADACQWCQYAGMCNA